MTHHTHRAVSALSRTVAWTHCVAKPGVGCSGAAHGGVTHVDRCRCGATRLTESNGRHVMRGAWQEAERIAPAGPRVLTVADALAIVEGRPSALAAATYESPDESWQGDAWATLRTARALRQTCIDTCGSRVRLSWADHNDRQFGIVE